MKSVVSLVKIAKITLTYNVPCQGKCHVKGSSPLRSFIISLSVLVLAACAMSHEIKQIESVQKLEQQKLAHMGSNLTGDQIFIRSCNTCHPGGKQGFGPSLENLDEHFPSDAQLRSFIRSGKGIMPAQPKTVLNDEELDSLIVYLRHMHD